MYPRLLPVNITQSEMGDVASAEAQPGEQQQNGTVPPTYVGCCVARRNYTLDIIRWKISWEARPAASAPREVWRRPNPRRSGPPRSETSRTSEPSLHRPGPSPGCSDDCGSTERHAIRAHSIGSASLQAVSVAHECNGDVAIEWPRKYRAGGASSRRISTGALHEGRPRA